MTTSAGSRLTPPAFLADEVQHRRLIGRWILEAQQGHLANTGTVTLAANTASTVLADYRLGVMSFLGFMPTTANAAAELGNGTLYVSTQGKQTATITHANNAQTDRTFTFAILG